MLSELYICYICLPEQSDEFWGPYPFLQVQNLGDVAPGSLTWFASGHGMHTSMLPGPVKSLYVPAGHAVNINFTS